jgi:hypothetical protein
MIQKTKFMEKLEKKAEADLDHDTQILEDDNSPVHRHKPRLGQLNIPRPPGNRIQIKYMNQLTLATIESEGMVAQQKPATAT